MINKRVNLKELYPFLKNDVFLESYCQNNYAEAGPDKKRKTILVLPGGAYLFCSEREGPFVATRLLGHDINAFVLYYSVAPNCIFPSPLADAYAAIDYIKKNADEYNVNVNSIGVMGFSAGGNLAGNVASHYNDPIFTKLFNCDDNYLRVDACLLGYPVVTRDPKIAHLDSFYNVTNKDEKLMDYYSFENYVTKDFPKTFIWHTCFDDCVPVQNSLVLANKLADNKVLFELHIDVLGNHGQSLADRSVYRDEYAGFADSLGDNKDWFNKAIKFIQTNI